MKIISAIAAAALMTVATPALVLAQAAPATLAPGTNDTTIIGTTPDDNMRGSDSQNNFIENITVSNFTDAVSVLDRASSVSIIHSNADQASAFNLKDSDLSALRAHISSSSKAMQALQGAGLTADQVVGIDAAGDGSVTLYVNG